MKNFKKKLAARGGFTLVELIVVIAILAILAGVGTAAYSGYINKANDAAVVTELDAIKTAALAANATVGGITRIEVTNATTVKITATSISDNFASDFKLFYGTSTPSATASNGSITLTIASISKYADSSYKNGAYWEAANQKWVAGTYTAPTTS